MFSRLLYGARVSLSIGFAGIAITMVLGFLAGGLAGYFGGAFGVEAGAGFTERFPFSG